MNFLILFFLMTSIASADEVFYDKNTKEILFIEDARALNLSAEDKARVAIAPVPKSFDKLEITRPVTDYQFSGGKIILNTKKISDAETKQVEDAKIQSQEDAHRNSGIEKLKKLGLTDEEIKALWK